MRYWTPHNPIVMATTYNRFAILLKKFPATVLLTGIVILFNIQLAKGSLFEPGGNPDGRTTLKGKSKARSSVARVSVGVRQFQNTAPAFDLSVFPIATTKELVVRADSLPAGMTAQLLDIEGQLIASQSLSAATSMQKLNLKSFKQGTYLLHITGPDHNIYHAFMLKLVQ